MVSVRGNAIYSSEKVRAKCIISSTKLLQLLMGSADVLRDVDIISLSFFVPVYFTIPSMFVSALLYVETVFPWSRTTDNSQY